MAVVLSTPVTAAARQPEIESRAKPVLSIGALHFRDLNANGVLDPYEDWRLAIPVRAADLVGRMTLEEKAGLMVHPNVPAVGTFGAFTDYNYDKFTAILNEKKAHSYLSALAIAPERLATANNRLQELAEGTRLGIPLTIASDPRHGFKWAAGISSGAVGLSAWPEMIGFGALGDVARTRAFGDIVRQEYRAVGLTEALSPQADIATEPRWTRIDGTFGSDAARVSALTGAYIEGIQGGHAGLTGQGVMAVVKHWAGYGAQIDGIDGHNYAGRKARLVGASLQTHMRAFDGAFAVRSAGIMPAYPVLTETSLDGTPVEQVAPGFNRQMLEGELRQKRHYTGVILSDWNITDDCNAACRGEGQMAAPAAGVDPDTLRKQGVFGKPWGMEDSTPYERIVKGINAGLDQIGGMDDAEVIVQAVRDGRVTETRIDQSAARVLTPLFEMGLFEDPFVDPIRAKRVAGSAAFVAQGRRAQSEAQVVLKNEGQLLPLRGQRTLFLFGIDPAVAERAGFRVVSDPALADLAIIKSEGPQGSLDIAADTPVFEALRRASAVVPTILSVYLSRPALLASVQPLSKAIVANFGASDAAILDVLTGRVKARGHLPFSLPATAQAVERQDPALANDDAHPLYRVGAGLSY